MRKLEPYIKIILIMLLNFVVSGFWYFTVPSIVTIISVLATNKLFSFEDYPLVIYIIATLICFIFSASFYKILADKNSNQPWIANILTPMALILSFLTTYPNEEVLGSVLVVAISMLCYLYRDKIRLHLKLRTIFALSIILLILSVVSRLLTAVS